MSDHMYDPCINGLTLPMLRLLSSKELKDNYFLENHLNHHVGINLIDLTRDI